MIVAVTGSSGFIGGHIVRRFSESGCEVRPIVRGDFVAGRLEDRFRGADAVVHVAGATRAPTDAELRVSNVELTERAIGAARVACVRRFIYMSSLAAVGPTQSREQPISGATAASPIEAYGRAKLDAEAAVRSSGLEWTIVRPAAVYGPGDRDFLALFRIARFGVAVHPGNRDQWLSIIHAQDLADAIVRWATGGETVGRVYCLSNDPPVQWADLFRIAAGCAGKRLAIDVEIPGVLVDAGAMLGDIVSRMTGRAGLLTSTKVALSKPPAWVCSSELAKRELGFTPRIPLDQGFCETYRWYLEHGWL